MRKIIAKLKSLVVKCDNISSSVQLNSMADTGNRHRNFFGGLLTIIIYIICIMISAYFFSFLFIKTNPKSNKIQIFSDNTPKISTDPNSMFFSMSYLSFSNFSINDSVISYYGRLYENLNEQTFHTLYEYKFDKCDHKNDEAIKNYFTKRQLKNFYKDFFCLSAMIVNDTEIPTSNPNFVYPFIQYGMTSKNPIFFEMGAKKRKNSTNNSSCIPSEQIEKIIDTGLYSFSFIDHYINQMDYASPIKKFVNYVNGVTKKGYKSTNILNYNYLNFITHGDFFWDKTSEISGYEFSGRQEFSSQSNDDIIFSFSVFPQNYPITYDRTYISFQEILANIGGIIKVLFIFAQLLNSLYQKFFNQKILFSNVINKYLCKYRKSPDHSGSHETKPNLIFKKKEESEPEIPEERPSKDYQKILDINQKIKKEQHTDRIELICQNQDKPPISNPKEEVKKRISHALNLEYATLNKSLKISWCKYIHLKFKQIWSKKEKFDVLTTFEKTDRIKNKVLNERTLYKCFFEIEKLKKIIFDEKQREIFKCCRLDLDHIFDKSNLVMTEKEMIMYLENENETKIINKRLKQILSDTLKAIS